MSDILTTNIMKRIIQIAGIGAIIFGCYVLHSLFVPVQKTYGTEEFWPGIIGFVIGAGFALIPCYVGGRILQKISQQSLQRLCALYVSAIAYAGASFSLPLQGYVPSM
ncbi:MAG: hypothetical protein GY801_31520 [bacterium]|nr:hypothetical protein [bacterium]